MPPVWRYPPTSTMSGSIRWIVEASVISRTGSARAPSRIISPSAPTEKSPDTGFTPECSPAKLLTNRPWSIDATSSSNERRSGLDHEHLRADARQRS